MLRRCCFLGITLGPPHLWYSPPHQLDGVAQLTCSLLGWKEKTEVHAQCYSILAGSIDDHFLSCLTCAADGNWHTFTVEGLLGTEAARCSSRKRVLLQRETVNAQYDSCLMLFPWEKMRREERTSILYGFESCLLESPLSDLEQWWSQNLQGAWKLQRIKQFNGLHQGSLEYHKQPCRNEEIEIFKKGNESLMNGCKTSQEKDNS